MAIYYQHQLCYSVSIESKMTPRHERFHSTVTSQWAQWRLKPRRLDGFLNHSFRRRSKKTSKVRVTGLCEGNSPMTGAFPAQMTSNAENVSIWWPRHATLLALCDGFPSQRTSHTEHWCFLFCSPEQHSICSAFLFSIFVLFCSEMF